VSKENKTILKRWFKEVWNDGNVDTMKELLGSKCVIHGLFDASGAEVQDPKSYRKFYQQFRGAFPAIKVTIKDMVAEGDKVVARCTVRGKHTGDHLGRAATNSSVAFEGITIVRIGNGKIQEAWNQFDFVKMNRQLDGGK